jgi:hypothetical protein
MVYVLRAIKSEKKTIGANEIDLVGNYLYYA